MVNIQTYYFSVKLGIAKTVPSQKLKGTVVCINIKNEKKGGGVAILVSDNLNYKIRPDLLIPTQVFEYCIVEVKLKMEKLICCSGYHAPNTDTEIFLKECENIVNSMNKTNSKIVMGLDHNLDLLNYDKHCPTREFICANDNANLVPGITKPTRITNTSATLIDNISISDKFVPMLSSQIIVDDISDHLPTCVVLENVNLGVKEKKKFLMWKLSKKAVMLICDELNYVNWDSYLSYNCSNAKNVNNVFNCIHNKFCDSVNRYSPLKEHTVQLRKFKSEPLITYGIKKSLRTLKGLYKKKH